MLADCELLKNDATEQVLLLNKFSSLHQTVETVRKILDMNLSVLKKSVDRILDNLKRRLQTSRNVLIGFFKFFK